jgi:hypothetical protein
MEELGFQPLSWLDIQDQLRSRRRRLAELDTTPRIVL